MSAEAKEIPIPPPMSKARSGAKANPQTSGSKQPFNGVSEEIHGSESEGTGTGSESYDESSEDEEDAQSNEGQEAQAPRRRPPATFRPPDGFAPMRNSQSASRSSQTFSTPSLAGKQVWHITAPSSAPIKNIKEVALEKVMRSEPILTHDGRDYGFIQEDRSISDRSRILVPSQDGQGYELAPTPFSQTLHLQQLVRLPQVPPSSNPLETPSASQRAAKAPREQPKGLRMRFFPFAFGNARPGSIGSDSPSPDEASDGDNGASRSTFRMPPEAESTERAKRKEQDASNTHEVPGGPPTSFDTHADEGPKRKRSKHKHRTDEQGGFSSEQQPNGQVPEPQGSTSQTEPSQANRSEPLDSQARHASESARRHESPAERALRKEEKRKRKREKLLKREQEQQQHNSAAAGDEARSDYLKHPVMAVDWMPASASVQAERREDGGAQKEHKHKHKPKDEHREQIRDGHGRHRHKHRDKDGKDHRRHRDKERPVKQEKRDDA